MSSKLKTSKLTYARRFTQGAFLLLFVFLFIETQSRGADELGTPVRLFLDFDPLILVTTLLSAHKASVAFYLSIITIVLTLVFGRFFCGIVCPLGTLNNIVGHIGRAPSVVRFGYFRLKYIVFMFLMFSSIFTLQLAGLLDPISLLIRSLSLSIYPAFAFTVTAVFDLLYTHGPEWMSAISEPVYSGLKQTVLPFEQGYFMQSVFIGAIFLFVLGLNLIERRFWCRYICPLGAMLGLLSRRPLIGRRVTEACTECGACSGVCQGAASPDVRASFKPEECYVCNNCDDVCPEGAVFIGLKGGSVGSRAPVDLGRRQVLGSAVAGVAVVPLLRVGPNGQTLPDTLLRPPGALAEADFLRTCVRCGECMKVCITGGLQPTLSEAGLEGLWTPQLVPKLGYCEFRCTLCGQVCPTGAIKKLNIEQKSEVKIGLAMLDKGRCLPWTHGKRCIVCEEVCPTAKKAIWFEEAEVEGRDGSVYMVKRPIVDLELCVGCGICEALCPVEDRPAIYVTRIGESRSDEGLLI